jgi:serine/threonine protein kinase/Tol biopolymer transport system component
MALTPGTILGQYEIRSPLGAGGMGEVYRARDLSLDRDVAIKVLPEALTNDPERLRRFEQEARAAAALNHPNILAVYQFASHEGIHYLVSELLEGETLRTRLSRGPLPLRKAIDYAIQIANGLAAPHEKRIIHRDLKPENLFITNDGRVKILDFGLARVSAPRPASSIGATVTTEPGLVIGTVGYMSPEQVRGKVADYRSDIFAFGSILYEMVSGIQTFRKATSAETMTAILNEEPAPVSQIAPATPPGLQRIVHRCLEKNPEERFQSASDLAFALEALSDSNISAPGSARDADGSRFSRLQLTLVATVLALALAITAVAAFWNRPPAVPKLSNYVQLTHDGHSKAILGTDGARIYLFLSDSEYRGLAEMSVSGGEPRRISMFPSGNMAPLALSPDGSEMLAIDGQGVPIMGPLWSVSTLGGSPRKVADIEAHDAYWSPDGKQIAYSVGNSLFIANKDGTGIRKLTTISSGNFIFAIAWSPDMTALRFTSQETLNSPSFIWEVPVDGSAPAHRLHESSDRLLQECCGSWVGDGKYYIYWNRGQLWSMPSKTLLHRSPQPVQLTSSPLPLSTPYVSKDGKKIFVIGQTDHGESMRYDPKTKRFESFLGGVSAEFFDFSRDGEWVTYTTYPDRTIWRSKVDGSERLQLTYPPYFAILPRWSPDGKQIIFFQALDGGVPKIYVVSRDGGNPHPLLPAEDAKAQQDPNWSPDGSKIVFGGASADPTSAIRIFDLKTNQVSTLPGSDTFFSPRWSPNGRYIAAMSSDSRRLLLFDFETQKWTELANGSLGWINWSKDGQSIYFIGGGGFAAFVIGGGTFSGNLMKVNIANHKIEEVGDLNGFSSVGVFGTSLSLARDDTPIVLRNAGTHDVYSIDIELP